MIGAGRAGQARVRALEEHGRAKLAALVRREGTPTLEDALADPAVQALLVCTPNASHEPLARAALEAGKHTLVEFPLAAGPEPARALFAQAARGCRVLHVEHIELLSPAQQRQRERVRALGRPEGGTLRFSGSNEGWIGDAELAGSPALRALARLQRLLDLFGAARVAGAGLESGGSGYRLQVELSFLAGGATTLVEERGPGRGRATRWAIQCQHGLLDDPEADVASGLFLRDLDCFLARVLDGGQPYVAEERVVEGLALVQLIEALL